MEAITPTLIAVGVVDLLMFPILAWLIKRMIGGRLDTFDARREDAKAQAAAERRLILAMARSQLLDNYERCIEKGYYTIDEREVYHELYEAYHKDGGNGIMDALAEKLTVLPTEPNEKKR